jgi:glycosyltransferase involved in cell wall biosynthesis
MISIIITAYNNPNYIHECLKTTIESVGDYEYEILLGIDNCQKTLSSVYNKNNKYKNLKIFYFPNRVGTYIIRNTLVNESKYKNLLFFDSDDIMKKTMIKDIMVQMPKYDCVKPMFSGFKDGDDINLPKFNEQKSTFGEGVFAIKKSVFYEMNGFEPWICAADSEFNWRLRANNKTFKYIERVCFYYRRHSTSLTTDTETGMKSKLRMKYHIITKNKKSTNSSQPLEVMVTSQFIVIDKNNIDDFLIDILPDNFNESDNIIFDKEKNTDLIYSIFNKEPKKIEQKRIIEKQVVVANNPLFNLMKKEPKEINEITITEKRKEIEQIKQKTKRQINDEFNPPKPNRRLDLPNIRIF